MPLVSLVAYYAGLFVLVDGLLFARQLNPFLLAPVLLAAALLTAASGLILLVQAIRRRSRQGWRRVAVASFVLLASYVGVAPLGRALEYARFAMQRRQLDALVHDLLADGRVQAMSDATRYFKELNGIFLRDVGPPVAPGSEAGPPDAVPLAAALARTGVDEPTYRRFRAALLEARYITVTVTPGYVAFVEGGMLDNLFGVVYVRPGHAPPPLGGEFVDGTQLVALRHLGGPWYAFDTT